jgi:hypothetical protein
VAVCLSMDIVRLYWRLSGSDCSPNCYYGIITEIFKPDSLGCSRSFCAQPMSSLMAVYHATTQQCMLGWSSKVKEVRLWIHGCSCIINTASFVPSLDGIVQRLKGKLKDRFERQVLVEERSRVEHQARLEARLRGMGEARPKLTNLTPWGVPFQFQRRIENSGSVLYNIARIQYASCGLPTSSLPLNIETLFYTYKTYFYLATFRPSSHWSTYIPSAKTPMLLIIWTISTWCLPINLYTYLI